MSPRRWADFNEDQRAAQYAKNKAYRESELGQETARRGHLRKHGVTPEWYDSQLARQGGVCAACRGPQSVRVRFYAVDHDHLHCPGEFGCADCVRGLLCQTCNMALGSAKDSSLVLQQLIDYLGQYQRQAIYISGAMSLYGAEGNWGFDNFNAAAARLRAAGFQVENPADKGIIDGFEWSDYLKLDLKLLLSRCRGVAMLPDWTKSKGARLEVHVAEELGMPCMSVDMWINSLQEVCS